MAPSADIPSWLKDAQSYRPGPDRDGFIARSLLSLSSVLAVLRLDGGRPSAYSPSAPVKALFCLGCILLTSLARNFLFVQVMLAATLVRACLLPREALSRVAAGSLAAAGVTLALMLPAVAIGQGHAAPMLATKALVCTALTLTMALTTPAHQITHSLASLHVPATVILTADLALRSIVSLGEVASETLVALRLRSVGVNRSKGASIGGVGGVVLIKAGQVAQQTYDAMRCRGFDGTYRMGSPIRPKPIDAAWLALLLGLALLFAHLQSLV